MRDFRLKFFNSTLESIKDASGVIIVILLSAAFFYGRGVYILKIEANKGFERMAAIAAGQFSGEEIQSVMVSGTVPKELATDLKLRLQAISLSIDTLHHSSILVKNSDGTIRNIADSRSGKPEDSYLKSRSSLITSGKVVVDDEPYEMKDGDIALSAFAPIRMEGADTVAVLELSVHVEEFAYFNPKIYKGALLYFFGFLIIYFVGYIAVQRLVARKV